MTYSPKNPNGAATSANSSPVVIATDQSAVAVSAASLPLPTGAATAAKQSDGTQQTKLTNGTSVVDVKTLGTQVVSTDNGLIVNAAIHGITTAGGGSYVDVKVNPSGAVTVDGSGTTQPVSGTVTANIGTAGSLALDATLTGGTLKATARGGAKGTTTAADITSNPIDANTQALHVDGSKVTQPVSGTVTVNAGTNLNTSALALETGGNLATTATNTGTVATNTTNIPNVIGTAASAIPSKLLQIGGSDGTNARAISTTTAGIIKVDISGTTANATAVKVDGSAVTQPVSASTLPLPTGASTETTLGTRLAESTFTTRIPVQGQATMAASIPVTIASNQSTLPVSLASVPSHAVTNAGTFAVQVSTATTGGYTPGKLISAATTNATSVKASAGTIGYITASNINASPRYLKIYNKASAPTVGTDVPVHTFLIPGNTSGAGTNIPIPAQGIALGTGIAFALTTGAIDSDTGAVAANEQIINYGWI